MRNCTILVSLLLFFAASTDISVLSLGVVPLADWTYDNSSETGPSFWPDLYPTCGGQHQSPINLNVSTALLVPGGGHLTFTGYDTPPADTTVFTITNNGHSAQVTLDKSSTHKMTVTGGGLYGPYILEQFHFHWGNKSTEGSEHTVNGTAYALEIHLVHYHTNYSDVSAAVSSNRSAALAVLGVFVNEAPAGATVNLSTSLGMLANALSEIPHEGNKTSIPVFALQDLLPSQCQQQFLRYAGSLTTPACNEVVMWSVFRTQLYITKDQMEMFRTSLVHHDGEPLTENFRPVQSINDRTVYLFNELPATCTNTGGGVSGANPRFADCNIAFLFLAAVAFIKCLIAQ